MANFNGTIRVGTPLVTPAVNVPVGATLAELNIDRTVPGGLNSLLTTTRLDVVMDFSLDGGTTWRQMLAAGTLGGIWVDDHTGATVINFLLATSPSLPGDPQSPTRKARLTAVATGQDVAYAATLTVT